MEKQVEMGSIEIFSRDDSTGKVGEIVSNYETARVLSSRKHGETVLAG